jgi:hypothetical protein
MKLKPSDSRDREARSAVAIQGRATGARRVALGCVAALAMTIATGIAEAEGDAGFLGTIHRFTTLVSTVPDNGDQNPYAVVVSPVSFGKVHQGDVLMTNFNDRNNLQGLGTTIVAYSPQTHALTQFAAIPRHLPQCPGGIGLTTAMAVLKSGWVVVGSLPSRDGTTATKGTGCLLILDGQGAVARVITSPNINGPWGNMAVVDRGGSATLFLSNTGFGVAAPGQDVVRSANVVRIELAVPEAGPPTVTRETVIANGFGEQSDKDVFVVGPTGLALGSDGTLYVSDAIDNRVAAIPDALTRTSSAGTGREVTKDGFLKRPLAMVMAPNGHLLVTNAQNGQLVEIDPASGRQLGALWIDANKAQTPPGSGDLFGIALTPAGDGFYYVKDEMNTLVLAH